MTASKHNTLIVGFLHNSIPKDTGKPTFEDVKIIHHYLNTNAMSVSSYEGGGRHGHLGLTMMNDEYMVCGHTHDTRPITFLLVVDDFGIKFVGPEHAEHLKASIEEHYQISCDWIGSAY
jgi:hypothetical protein